MAETIGYSFVVFVEKIITNRREREIRRIRREPLRKTQRSSFSAVKKLIRWKRLKKNSSEIA